MSTQPIPQPAPNDWQTVPAQANAQPNDWQTLPPAHQEALGLLNQVSQAQTHGLQMPMRQAQAIQAQNAPVNAISNATALNNFLPPAGMTVGGLVGSLAGPGGAAAGAAAGGALGKDAAQHAAGLDTDAWPQIKGQLENAAIGGGSELALGTLLPKIAGAWSGFPTTGRAAKLFQEVMDAAKDEPVNLTRTQPALDRVAQLTDAGAPVMTAPNKLLLRSQTVNPIPYQEARDFYSNISNLSTQEKLGLNGPMKKAVGELASAFKEDIGDTATTVGKGEQYYKAMQQYRQAKQIQGAIKTAVKYGGGAVMGGTLLYPALHALQDLLK